MITLVAFLTLFTIVFHSLYAYISNRDDNLEALNSDLRDQLAEVCYQLDDARREADRLRRTNDALIAENSTLLVDLMHTDARCAYLESLHRQRKGETAGVLLTSFVVNPKRKLTIHSENLP